jgi:hypothetical protein
MKRPPKIKNKDKPELLENELIDRIDFYLDAVGSLILEIAERHEAIRALLPLGKTSIINGLRDEISVLEKKIERRQRVLAMLKVRLAEARTPMLRGM